MHTPEAQDCCPNYLFPAQHCSSKPTADDFKFFILLSKYTPNFWLNKAKDQEGKGLALDSFFFF